MIEVIEPDQRVMGQHSIRFFGLGTLTITMTVTCDERVTATGTYYWSCIWQTSIHSIKVVGCLLIFCVHTNSMIDIHYPKWFGYSMISS